MVYKENDIITIKNQNEFARIAQYCNDNGLFLDTQDDNKFIVRNKRYYITKEMEIDTLRLQRETECFPIVNRGQLWYNTLTEKQTQELNTWYQSWLDITDKYVDGIDINSIIPEKPSWLK